MNLTREHFRVLISYDFRSNLSVEERLQRFKRSTIEKKKLSLV